MTRSTRTDDHSHHDLKSEIVSDLGLEAVINLGSLEALLDHLEKHSPEGRS